MCEERGRSVVAQLLPVAFKVNIKIDIITIIIIMIIVIITITIIT